MEKCYGINHQKSQFSPSFIFITPTSMCVCIHRGQIKSREIYEKTFYQRATGMKGGKIGLGPIKALYSYENAIKCECVELYVCIKGYSMSRPLVPVHSSFK